MGYDYTVYGSRGCGQCAICKNLFDAKHIKYCYVDIADLDDATVETMMELARKDGRGSLPMVLDEATWKFVSWQEVVKNA